MARRYDARKEAEWGKRLKRFRRSGLTVARFCAEEHVSVASLYYWYKKLGQAASPRRTRSRPGVFRQVAVVPAPPVMAPDHRSPRPRQFCPRHCRLRPLPVGPHAAPRALTQPAVPIAATAAIAINILRLSRLCPLRFTTTALLRAWLTRRPRFFLGPRSFRFHHPNVTALILRRRQNSA